MAHSLPLSKRHNGLRAESIHTWALPSASTGSLELERSGEPFIDRFLASAWAQTITDRHYWHARPFECNRQVSDALLWSTVNKRFNITVRATV